MREVALLFGLGASSRPLLEAFAADLDHEAFLADWRNQGYSNAVNSWLSEGPNEPVSPEAFEAVYGADRLQHLADRVGLNARTCAEALAFATPAILHLDERNDGVASQVATPGSSSNLGLGALASLAAIVLLVGWFSTRGTVKPAAAPKPRVASASVERPTGLAPSYFSVKLDRNGGLEYSASLRDQGERKQLEAALAGMKTSGTIEVDLGVNRAPWLDSVRELVRDMPTGSEIAISDDLVVLKGFGAAAVAIVRDRVSGLNVRAAGHGPAAEGENALAIATFESMNSPSMSDWLQGTKLIVLAFRSGGVRLSAEGQDVLQKAAEALLRSKSGGNILIAGYTDSTGSEAGNRRLSQLRAEAVMEALVNSRVSRSRLTAVGYGPDDPVADNDTGEGRAKNRRIEFRLAD